MKKLFVAVLAIAALAACNKDSEMQFIESNKKAIEISIANYVENTRVIDAPDHTKVEGDGQDGTIEAQAADQYAAAKAEELVVLFANNANVVEQAFALNGLTATEGKYLFHDINESVTQVAVVRKVETATKAEGAWTYTYDITPANFIGDNLSDYRSAALVEYADNRGVDGMDLFAVSGLTRSTEGDGNCTVTDQHANKTYTYALFTAKVEVKPMLARVEVTRISCTDLGETTFKAANGVIEDGKVVTGGFDELVLGTIKFGGEKNYTYDLNDFVLKGVYEKGNKETKRDLTYFEAGDDDTKYAVAWNIATKTAYPLVASNAMTLDMVASAYDYTVVNTAQNLTIGFDKAGSAFEPGKIYRVAIDFKESNLDESNEAICVEVEVVIAKWVVVNVDPTYKN